MTIRRMMRRVLTPFAIAAAIVWFVIDLAFVSVITPLVARLAELSLIARAEAWVASLGPYPTLGLFLVPVIVLEPAKPVGLYLMASGHALAGILLIVLAELIKIGVIERLFHAGRNNLMTIPAFAWGYGFVLAWLAELRAWPPWQAVQRRVLWAKAKARRVLAAVRDQI